MLAACSFCTNSYFLGEAHVLFANGTRLPRLPLGLPLGLPLPLPGLPLPGPLPPGLGLGRLELGLEPLLPDGPQDAQALARQVRQVRDQVQ